MDSLGASWTFFFLTPSQALHTHLHFFISYSLVDFFHTLKQAEAQKHAHWYAQGLDSTITCTHSHNHVSAVSWAPECLHSSQSLLQRVLHFVHQAPGRNEWECKATSMTQYLPQPLYSRHPIRQWVYIKAYSCCGKWCSQGDAHWGHNDSVKGCPPVSSPIVKPTIHMHAILTASSPLSTTITVM